MKKLILLAIALGSIAVACQSPPTSICIACGDGGNGGDGGSGEGGAGNTGNTGNGGDAGQGGDPVKPTEQTARDIYMQEVHPSIIDTCGGCHQASAQLAPGWMDTDPATSYELSKVFPGIMADPATNSSLITKGPHDGPGLTDVQKGVVEKWLNKEIEEGKGGGTTMTTTAAGTMPDPGPTVDSMLKEFGACMDYNLWVAEGMEKFPDQQTQLGPCKSCHNQGLGGTYLSGDSLATFEAHTALPFILRMVLPIYENGKPVDLAPSLRYEVKGTEKCNNANPATCHPKYTLNPENLQAFEGFVDGTLKKWRAGTCGP